jgi:5-(carboxyamino)imidazole ribonucleotide synthase
LQLAERADVVTLENEFVNLDALAAIEAAGHPLFPTVATMRLVQDKLLQKQTFAAAGLPVPRFADAPTPDAVRAFGFPCVLKKRRNGYDGKGNATLRTAADLPAAWAKLEGDRLALYVEEFCEFARELAVIITRGQRGEIVRYPVVETINRDHICHIVKAPLPDAGAAELAQRAVEAVGGVGSFGMEFFQRADGSVLINEIAPRVHNTGHYTIEACVCSQFENHVRAVLGWPLGSPAMRAPAAVMINLLGAGDGDGTPVGLERALAVPGAHIHIYGKRRSARGRKMGHVTALGATMDEALATARQAADSIRFGA